MKITKEYLIKLVEQHLELPQNHEEIEYRKYCNSCELSFFRKIDSYRIGVSEYYHYKITYSEFMNEQKLEMIGKSASNENMTWNKTILL